MDKPNFSSEEEFVSFLKNTLIPDLKRSGTTATAEDFEEAVYWLNVASGHEELVQEHYRAKVEALQKDIEFLIKANMNLFNKKVLFGLGIAVTCFILGMTSALCIYQFGYWRPF